MQTGTNKSFFSEWTNYVTNKFDKRITYLANNLYTYTFTDCLSSPFVKIALNNIQKYFLVVSTDNATGNTAPVCRRFYVYVTAKELGLNISLSTDTSSKINSLSAVDITNNIIDNIIGSDNIPIENHQLPNIYWMLKIHKSPIKARFIVGSPNSSMKPLARTVTSIFCLLIR